MLPKSNVVSWMQSWNIETTLGKIKGNVNKVWTLTNNNIYKKESVNPLDYVNQIQEKCQWSHQYANNGGNIMSDFPQRGWLDKECLKNSPRSHRLPDNRHCNWKMLREKLVCSLGGRVKDRVRVMDGCSVHSLVIKNSVLTFNTDILKHTWHNSCIKSALSEYPAFICEKGPLQWKLAWRMTSILWEIWDWKQTCNKKTYQIIRIILAQTLTLVIRKIWPFPQPVWQNW